MLSKKRILLALSATLVLILGLITGLLWWFTRRNGGLAATWVVGALNWGLAAVVIMGIVGILFTTVALKKGLPVPQRVVGILDFLFPLAVKLRGLLGFSLDEVRSSFIAIHNAVTQNQRGTVCPSDVLVLAPVCLQEASCSVKITHDVGKCKRCGRCTVKDLLDLQAEYGFDLAVVTGGTIARKLVAEKRPKAVVAIACERDLTSGIQETRGMKVIGIANERPNGPCFNTRVDVGRVIRALEVLTGKEKGKLNGAKRS